ncbi:hypothetical protein PG984_002693 [Apiospora sp. TS-2023a]
MGRWEGYGRFHRTLHQEPTARGLLVAGLVVPDRPAARGQICDSGRAMSSVRSGQARQMVTEYPGRASKLIAIYKPVTGSQWRNCSSRLYFVAQDLLKDIRSYDVFQVGYLRPSPRSSPVERVATTGAYSRLAWRRPHSSSSRMNFSGFSTRWSEVVAIRSIRAKPPGRNHALPAPPAPPRREAV